MFKSGDDISISLIQRKCQVGYNTAYRTFEKLVEDDLIERGKAYQNLFNKKSTNRVVSHAGNRVIDVSDAQADWEVNKFICEMEYHLKRLKTIQKEKQK